MSEAPERIKPYVSLLRRLRDEPTEGEYERGIRGQEMMIWNDLCLQAAERIEELEAENKELRGDLNIANLRLKASLGEKGDGHE